MGTEVYSLDQYDVIQLSLTGLSGVVRKETVSSRQLKEILQNTGSIHFGDASDTSNSLIYDVKSCSGSATLDLSTLRELPWYSTREGERVGGAMCEIVPPDPAVMTYSPRAAALKQIQRLQEEFGLTVMSAFEAEFMIFEQDGITPFNNVHVEPYGRMDNMAGRETTLLDMCFQMEEAGLPLESFMTEYAAAQFELTFHPEKGVSSADTVMVMKDAVRTILGRNKMVATFMACPREEGHPNGFHFNHSLWTKDGHNAFLDCNHPFLMSDTARHWIAGLIHHAQALTAILSPTINCYRRLANKFRPKWANWAVENKACSLRVKTEKRNVHIENRLPSSASNPYLSVAAILAAGMDGLVKKLTCPPQLDTSVPTIPRKPEDSIQALEQDEILKESLGEDIVSGFIEMFKKGIYSEANGSFEVQREIYFQV